MCPLYRAQFRAGSLQKFSVNKQYRLIPRSKYHLVFVYYTTILYMFAINYGAHFIFAVNCNSKLNIDPFYSEENISRLKQSIAQMEKTGGTVHEVDEI